ncbi:Sporulation related domain-containing protein [Mariniphaga anaerophila]|uniref:Sporulation related domain-containing protein n=1 Tax=Mariniphaga anaerophila TaxID=1484053 RepID=A0A1M5CG90_9BACT|nr:SPOR domain-containing protein [Mariniphaga anaerophila]SHF53686.1 Sporulation related domain-containing protein [Mariniphaga anaerophila]
MPVRLLTIFSFFVFAASGLFGQSAGSVRLVSTRDKVDVLPGQIVNLAFFAENKTNTIQNLDAGMNAPSGWRLISPAKSFSLQSGERKFLIFSVQIPSVNPVGKFKVELSVNQVENGDVLDLVPVVVTVGEVEKIEMHLVESPQHIKAGEEFRSEFLLQNLGNTGKKVFIETRNCSVEGQAEIEIAPGQSIRFFATHPSSDAITETVKNYYTVRALVSGKVTESIFSSYTTFPVKEGKKDLYLRFPVEFGATYLASNQRGSYEHAYQFELSGSGSLDEKGKHRMEFLARGPNNTNLSFLGLYDQYFVSYANDNLELFAGEKSFSFTPLTESSRFGLGAESKVKFNNGLNFGFLYVKPRFYQEIDNEMAAFAGVEFNKKNNVGFYLVSKQLAASPEMTQLASLNSQFQPFSRTSVELEFSRGRFGETWDNAMRANLSSQFSVFNLAGNYYYTGKNYPGYYSNSTFYSGNFSVNLTPKLSLGIYAKEDFINAQLDTFFVTAPYSRSFQYMANYNLASRAYLKLYWRQYERKDRLALDKFHYKTNSINAQVIHRFNRLEYNILGEYGETTNFMLESGQNQQTMYRGSVNLAYRFNSKHAVRVFGSWSNVNRFISGDQQNFMAGMAVVSQLAKNLRANFHIQNAYNIEDYYRNRNLMQLNVDFTPVPRHKISLRSFYTLFRQETENPELTFSLNYAYKFGIPLKKIVDAGDLKGYVTRANHEPAEGIVVSFFNKTAITGKNGEFSFKAVPTGTHILYIDRSGLAIDEIPEIADQLSVEILEDETTELNFRIAKGARLRGSFEVQESALAILQKGEVKVQNIIVELKNEQEQFRITSEANGKFSFPLVRPGEWTFRVYTNSLPEGYELENPVVRINLEPGQDKHLELDLKPRKRNIIFKSDNKVLQPLKQLNNQPESRAAQQMEIEKESESHSDTFYSVQVGAFGSKKSNDATYFQEAPYDFEVQIGTLYKYFIGRFPKLGEAEKEKQKLEKIYKNAFVVKFENGRLAQ